MSEKTLNMLLPYGKAAVILIAGLIVMKILLVITKRALTRSSLDAAMHSFVLSVIKIGCIIVLIVAVLVYMGVPAAPFVTVIGAAGAAVALALKDSLANVAGGIMILVNKPFKRSDYIKLGDVEGYVDSIDLMVTMLKTIDNKVIIAPNGTVNTAVLINYSRENKRRVDLVFAIGYENDIVRAKNILKETAEACPMVIDKEQSIIGVIAQSDSSIDIDCKVWCKTGDYWDLKYYMEEAVKTAFEEAGISIPFPQMDIHIADDDSCPLKGSNKTEGEENERN